MLDTQKIALVTGANKGIGKHVAHQLAQRGVFVLAGSRDLARGAATVDEFTGEGLASRVVTLDVTSDASVAAAVADVVAGPARLDILVNNAGITSGLDSVATMSVDDVRRTYETNVFGVVRATNAFLPLLRESSAPRIVNVSSGLGSLSMMSDPNFAFADLNNGAYQSSKAALNALTILYAKELRAEGFKINAVSPGYRATDLRRRCLWHRERRQSTGARSEYHPRATGSAGVLRRGLDLRSSRAAG